MGCDIHVYLETLHEGEWVMVKECQYPSKVRTRNYTRFNRLAGVRYGDDLPSRTPKGLPNDISQSVKMFADRWDCDAHSHSWLTLSEFIMDLISTDYEFFQGDKILFCAGKKPLDIVDYYFDEYIEPYEWDLHRVVFWFDN